jgi:hypothetical protein
MNPQKSYHSFADLSHESVGSYASRIRFNFYLRNFTDIIDVVSATAGDKSALPPPRVQRFWKWTQSEHGEQSI